MDPVETNRIFVLDGLTTCFLHEGGDVYEKHLADQGPWRRSERADELLASMAQAQTDANARREELCPCTDSVDDGWVEYDENGDACG